MAVELAVWKGRDEERLVVLECYYYDDYDDDDDDDDGDDYDYLFF